MPLPTPSQLSACLANAIARTLSLGATRRSCLRAAARLGSRHSRYRRDQPGRHPLVSRTMTAAVVVSYRSLTLGNPTLQYSGQSATQLYAWAHPYPVIAYW